MRRPLEVESVPGLSVGSAAPAAPDGASLWLRFLSGPDIDALEIPNREMIAAVEEAVRAHGNGQVVVEPRVHLVPDNGGPGTSTCSAVIIAAGRERHQGRRRLRVEPTRRGCRAELRAAHAV